MDTARLYSTCPIPVQNIGLSLYGLRINRQRYGGHFWKYVDEISARDGWDTERLTKYQMDRLDKVLRYASEHVPFYKKRHLGAPRSAADAFTELPILDKNEVKERKAEFLSDEYSSSRLIRITTGGTTGTPLTLLFTLDQIRMNFAYAEARIRRWAGASLRDRTATFLGRIVVPIRQRRPPFWRLNAAANQELFSIYHLSSETAESYIDELSRFSPEVLVGYPSVLAVLSKYISEKGAFGFRPRLIWVSSETLLPVQREVIEKAFGTRVTNAYSLAEGVAFASECEQGRLHVSPDFGLIELLPTGRGLCKIIGTTLFNYSMPLIRFDTGDLALPFSERHGRCPCGRQLPVIGEIVGRSGEAVVTARGTAIGAAPLSLVFQSRNWIDQAQVVQESVTCITVRVVTRDDPAPRLIEDLVSALKLRLGDDVDISVVRVGEIQRTGTGKQRFIVSAVPPP